jgi:hypothetical protein
MPEELTGVMTDAAPAAPTTAEATPPFWGTDSTVAGEVGAESAVTQEQPPAQADEWGALEEGDYVRIPRDKYRKVAGAAGGNQTLQMENRDLKARLAQGNDRLSQVERTLQEITQKENQATLATRAETRYAELLQQKQRETGWSAEDVQQYFGAELKTLATEQLQRQAEAERIKQLEQRAAEVDQIEAAPGNYGLFYRDNVAGNPSVTSAFQAAGLPLPSPDQLQMVMRQMFPRDPFHKQTGVHGMAALGALLMQRLGQPRAVAPTPQAPTDPMVAAAVAAGPGGAARGVAAGASPEAIVDLYSRGLATDEQYAKARRELYGFS